MNSPLTEDLDKSKIILLDNDAFLSKQESEIFLKWIDEFKAKDTKEPICGITLTTDANINTGGYVIAHYGNLIMGVRDGYAFSSYYFQPSDKNRYLAPYQFSGILTTPFDSEYVEEKKVDKGWERFWLGVFLSFFEFLVIPITLVSYVWSAFAGYILNNGEPDSVTRAHLQNDVLQDKKDKIKQVNSSIPVKIPPQFLPSVKVKDLNTPSYSINPDQAGIGIWAETHDAMIYQVYDPSRKLSETINDFSNNYAQQIPSNTVRLHFRWLSKDYRYNDGDCYGSIKIYQSNY